MFCMRAGVDDEGSLRPDALTSASAVVVLLCEVYLGTKKLLSRELAVEPVSLYSEFRDFQQ